MMLSTPLQKQVASKHDAAATALKMLFGLYFPDAFSARYEKQNETTIYSIGGGGWQEM